MRPDFESKSQQKAANDNHTPDLMTEMVNAIFAGQKLAAAMDGLTLRAMREGWTPEKYHEEVNAALFGRPA